MSNNIAEAFSSTESDDWQTVSHIQQNKTISFIHTGSIEIVDYELFYGGRLHSCEINYNCYGSLHKPVIVVLGGISSSRNIHEWWEKLLGEARALDPEEFCVIGIDYISNQNSTSQNLISTFDQAKMIDLVLSQLKLDRIEAVVGSSYGGMVALAFASLFPAKLRRLVCIAAAHTNTQRSIALRQIQQQILSLGIETGRLKETISIARQIGIVTYRGQEELENRFQHLQQINGQSLNFDIVNYLKYQGEKFASHFDIEKYRSLSQSIDLHKVDPKELLTRSLFIGIDSDQLVPAKLVEDCANSCRCITQYQSINSKFGHDGFLLETEQLTNAITPFLRNL